MILRRRILAILLLCGAAMHVAAAEREQDAVPDVAGIGPAGSEYAAFQGSGMTLSQAVEQVRRQYGGRIVSAETQVNGGRETHVIKVLTEDGKVKTVRIPGRRD